MKKTAFSLIFMMALSSNCGKEEGGSLRIEGTHLTIQELRDYVPISWQQEDKLIYKNEAGEEKTLHISYLDGVARTRAWFTLQNHLSLTSSIRRISDFS